MRIMRRLIAVLAALALCAPAAGDELTASGDSTYSNTVVQMQGQTGDVRRLADRVHQRLLNSIEYVAVNDAQVLADGKIYIGDGANTPAAQTMGGIATITSGGTTAFVQSNTLGANPAMGANVIELFTTGLGGEGATADAFEWLLTATDPTADRTFTFPDNTGTVILQTADTVGGNPALAANGLVVGTTGLLYEGATADAFEGVVVITDPTADRTFTLPDQTGTFMLITSDTIGGNPALGGNGVVVGTTGIIFEGATADANEGLLTVTDPTTDRTYTLPDATGTVVLATTTGLTPATATVGADPALDADGLILGTTGLVFEGGTADTAEALITVADPTADRTFTFPDNTGTVILQTSDTVGADPALAANGLVIGTTGPIFEGSTADTAETLLTVTDPTGDNTITLPDDTGTVILDTTDTIGADPALAASDVVHGTTGFIFEGSTADTAETLLTLTDPTADRTITLPDATGTVFVSGQTLTLANSESLNAGTDATFDFTRDDTGTVTITSSDDDGTAALTVDPGGTATLTLGGAGDTVTSATNVTLTSTETSGSCTLDGASPSVCTATVTASTLCVCANVGATAAIAANGCAVGLSGTTLTVTGANAATHDVNYHCF